MILVAIDPGADTGAAVFCNGSLFSAQLCKPGDVPHIPTSRDGLAVFVEMPNVRRARDTPARPNDIKTLAYRAGKTMGAIATWHAHCSGGAYQEFEVLPEEWKGQLDKVVTANKAQAALSTIESLKLTQCLVPIALGKRHNVMDAVCLGLWALGRIDHGPRCRPPKWRP